mgnify:CR=1 FL=1
MQFWDTEPAKPVFDYDVERKRFIDNMEYLSTMPVEEQTLYKKWQEWNSDLPKSMARKPSLAKSFDMIWTPTDIYNKELTIKEIEEFNIGHFIIGESVSHSISKVVKQFIKIS